MAVLYVHHGRDIAINRPVPARKGRSDHLESQLPQFASRRARALQRLEGLSNLVAFVCPLCAGDLRVFPVVRSLAVRNVATKKHEKSRKQIFRTNMKERDSSGLVVFLFCAFLCLSWLPKEN